MRRTILDLSTIGRIRPILNPLPHNRLAPRPRPVHPLRARAGRADACLVLLAALLMAACSPTPTAPASPDEPAASGEVGSLPPTGVDLGTVVAPAPRAAAESTDAAETSSHEAGDLGALVEGEDDIHGDAPEDGIGEGGIGEAAAAESADLVPMPAPSPGKLTRLTEPGCCTQPFWSADGRRVLFVDKPAPDQPVGIWAARLDRPGAPPELVVEGMASYSADLAYRVEREAETTTLVRLADGQRWTVPAGGRAVSISPGGTRIAWQVSPNEVPAERRTSRVWVAELDGSEAREVATLPRGSLAAWLGDDRLLVRGRERLDADEDILWALPLGGGERHEIMRSERISGIVPSPDGRWIAYYVARLTDPAANGLWIAPTTPGAGPPKRLDASLFGAYRWRDADRLLLVPMHADAARTGAQPSHELWEIDAATLAGRQLTDPTTTPFKITGGDWAVSPDGQRVAFVESGDKAVWVLDLPEGQ